MVKISDKNISLAVVKRLPKYYRNLGELLDMDITRISSKELSERLSITASQIRQDLNNFGSFGLQGYGYNVELLYNEIGKILGLDKKHSVIIIGFGNVGQALLNYKDFTKRGFSFVNIFDKSHEKIGKSYNGIVVQDIDSLEDYLTTNPVDIAILSVPQSSTNYLTKILHENKIRGIWNFSNVDLVSNDKVVVEDVHLMDSLMTLSYKINEEEIIKRYANSKK